MRVVVFLYFVVFFSSLLTVLLKDIYLSQYTYTNIKLSLCPSVPWLGARHIPHIIPVQPVIDKR